MNEYLKAYDYFCTHKCCPDNARYYVIELIMQNDYLSRRDAEELLSKLIYERFIENNRMIPSFLIQLMCRIKIPAVWGRKHVVLEPEQKISVDLADALRELTLRRKIRAVWLHIPNEGKRSQLVAMILKAMGLIPGAPDFLFCWGEGSAFIELKAGRNKQSDSQKHFELWCISSDVKYEVCYSADAALTKLKSWGIISD